MNCKLCDNQAKDSVNVTVKDDSITCNKCGYNFEAKKGVDD